MSNVIYFPGCEPSQTPKAPKANPTVNELIKEAKKNKPQGIFIMTWDANDEISYFVSGDPYDTPKRDFVVMRLQEFINRCLF